MVASNQPRLKETFNKEIRPALAERFGLKNPMALPTINKVVISVGMGKSLEGTKINAKMKETVIKDLATISGQKPVITRARRSVSNFKLREGYEIGCMVTMRGARMWEFLDRLISLAIPRIKDFRGLRATSFDAQGNYSMGVTEQGIFPEVDMANLEVTHGMNITFVFNNSNPERSLEVLKLLGMPFASKEDERESARRKR